MTTTGTYQGLTGEKNSSRVLRPPGGGSSNIFGAEEPAGKQSAQPARDNNIFGPAVNEAPPPPRKVDTASNLFGAEDSPSKQKPSAIVRNPITGAIMSGTGDYPEDKPQITKNIATYNPITGEETASKETGQLHTSTRVRQPPGGASSKLW